MMPESTNPFSTYPGGGRHLLGRVRGANCRREYGLRHQQVTGQNTCGYCGKSLVDSYDHWLQMAYDHVVPANVGAAATIPTEWMDDMINRVLSCVACNGFKNRWKPETPAACPANLEAFLALRDSVFAIRKVAIQERHVEERGFYDKRPWEGIR